MKIISTTLALLSFAQQQSELPAAASENSDIEDIQTTRQDHVDLTSYFKDWLDSNTKDPDSVKMKLTTPARHRLVVLKRGLLGKKKWSGWIACYRINAKNSYGAYTGYRPVAVMKTDDNRLMVWVDNQGSDNHYRSYERQIVENNC